MTKREYFFAADDPEWFYRWLNEELKRRGVSRYRLQKELGLSGDPPIPTFNWREDTRASCQRIETGCPTIAHSLRDGPPSRLHVRSASEPASYQTSNDLSMDKEKP